MEHSSLLESFRALGARTRAEPPGILTFGDVPAEYRAATEGAALFDATDRGLVHVSGADAVDFLHRLLSNDVRALELGATQRNLLLSSKGKVLFDFELEKQPDRVALSIASARAPALLKALDTYLFAEKVRFADATSTHAPLDLVGPRAPDVVRAATGLATLPADRSVARTAFRGAPLAITALPIAGSPGFRLDAGPERALDLWNALVASGARASGLVARESLRVEAGAAEWGADVDENVYPQEARLESAFSLSKGCYIGQEVVAKIDTYGGLNKRLVALRIAHDDPVPRGTRLFRLDEGEWRDLGVITSWAYSFVLDTGLALGFVKRRHQSAGTEFRLGEGPATATIVPLPVRPNTVPVTGEFE